MKWTPSYVKSLPDSAFLYAKAGKRFFPFRTKEGEVDKGKLAEGLRSLKSFTHEGLTPEAKQRIVKNAVRALRGDDTRGRCGGISAGRLRARPRPSREDDVMKLDTNDIMRPVAVQ